MDSTEGDAAVPARQHHRPAASSCSATCCLPLNIFVMTFKWKLALVKTAIAAVKAPLETGPPPLRFRLRPASTDKAGTRR